MFFETNVVGGNSLLDMDAKCGWVAEATQVFNNFPVKDVVSWTSLMLMVV